MGLFIPYPEIGDMDSMFEGCWEWSRRERSNR